MQDLSSGWTSGYVTALNLATITHLWLSNALDYRVYGGWRNRKMLGFMKIFAVPFSHALKVCWYRLAFNEIKYDSLHAPFMEQDSRLKRVRMRSSKPQIRLPLLTIWAGAPAWWTKIGSWDWPENKVGCSVQRPKYSPSTWLLQGSYARRLVVISSLMFKLVESVQIMLRNSGTWWHWAEMTLKKIFPVSF